MSITSTDIIRAAENGIGYRTLRTRIYRGWDRERAVTEPPNALKKYRDLAAENNIPMKTYETRVYNLGWTYEKAATEPVRKYKKYAKTKKEIDWRNMSLERIDNEVNVECEENKFF